VILLVPALRLLTFHAPEYELDGTRGPRSLAHRARPCSSPGEGRNGNGYLQIEVTRRPGASAGRACVHVEVEVATFYPSIASSLSHGLYDRPSRAST